ncbi:hypothetical protein SERLADRAFT_477452 [Serpula lacrymans var. lacrymans S7.9]|uniref:Nephrocystin 3-like N-terminal domain-containing protein n=1 Tax=Serpula lacrymans var. lacrymans (strain S7.9) TaxID=578457 RepID=F8P905_SERL9|nr:uncharacterized protein SERLADRAFT_477452 [Serpula lacrymans var. lacrymans S7.9]EGO20134.1 hypothetical protein SERLADRAFT_477452 [Serpula lacrymans var. lacrymans S7.9]
MKKRLLGGFFSFRRDDAALSNPTALWRTIADQIAKFDPMFKSIIIKTLKDNLVDPQRPNIHDHFDSLIVESINAYFKEDQQDQRYPVFVVDALDECGESSEEPQRKALLETLTEWSSLSKMFKLIITSRDDRIPSKFREACEDVVLPTGDHVTHTATDDIRAFFNNRFGELKDKFRTLRTTDWPGTEVVEQLTDRAAGLFIWAETAMRFLEKGDPQTRLKIIRSGGPLDIQNSVNHLYQQITTNAWDSIGDIGNVVQPLLGAIVHAKVPLSLKFLEDFIASCGTMDDSIAVAIDRVLAELTSVISVGKDEVVRIEHLSFMEFLVESDLCPDAFRIRRARGI